MFLELFLFAKHIKLFTKRRDSLYLGLPLALSFYARALELTEHGYSAADIMVHSRYIYVL